VREVDLGFAIVVLDGEEATGVTLEPAVGSNAVVELLGGTRARDMGRDFVFSLGLDRGFDSLTTILVSSFAFPALPQAFSLCLAFVRPTKLSASASFSEPDASFNDLRGRFREERGTKTEACDLTGEGLDLRAEDVPMFRDGETRES